MMDSPYQWTLAYPVRADRLPMLPPVTVLGLLLAATIALGLMPQSPAAAGAGVVDTSYDHVERARVQRQLQPTGPAVP